MGKMRFERIILKDREFHGAKWEVCLEGPSQFTDLGTLCGKTSWACDFEKKEADQNAEVTCNCCLGVMKWIQERSL